MLDHIERNWVQYLVVFLTVGCLVVGGLMFFEWLNLPTCRTVAEYSPYTRRPEGSKFWEVTQDVAYWCRVPRYLPSR